MIYFRGENRLKKVQNMEELKKSRVNALKETISVYVVNSYDVLFTSCESRHRVERQKYL